MGELKLLQEDVRLSPHLRTRNPAQLKKLISSLSTLSDNLKSLPRHTNTDAHSVTEESGFAVRNACVSAPRPLGTDTLHIFPSPEIKNLQVVSIGKSETYQATNGTEIERRIYFELITQNLIFSIDY